jgi:hypothetical protein
LSLPARYPRHAVLGALVVGMLAARHPAALLLTPLLAPRRPLFAGLLLAAAFTGSWLAQARSAQLDRTALTPLFGHAVAEPVTLLDLPRDTPFGGWQATVSLRGERVVGYVPPVPSTTNKTYNAYLVIARYTLAPTYVVYNTKQRLLIVDGVAGRSSVPPDFTVRRDFGGGLVLLERPAR